MKTMEVSLGHGGISQMMVCHTGTWKPTLVAKKRFQVRKSSSCTSVRGHGFYLMDVEMLGISPVLALQPKGIVIGHVPGYMATCIFQRFRGRKLGDNGIHFEEQDISNILPLAFFKAHQHILTTRDWTEVTFWVDSVGKSSRKPMQIGIFTYMNGWNLWARCSRGH